jgi:TPR repeat protein
MSKPSTFGFLGRIFSRHPSPARPSESAPGAALEIRNPCRFDDCGLAEDFPEAIDRARKGAEEGDATAQNSFGLRFASGEGVPRSEAEASKWFRRAAQQGLADAQFNLGNLFYSASLSRPPVGTGEARIEAYMWYHLAAAQGHQRAGAFEETLNLQLTDSELHEGNRRAQAFHARNELLGNPEN